MELQLDHVEVTLWVVAMMHVHFQKYKPVVWVLQRALFMQQDLRSVAILVTGLLSS
jgi:hypothetical protein